MEGITQVESSSAFNERPINFTVNVHEYTLDEAYTFRAFVRALDQTVDLLILLLEHIRSLYLSQEILQLVLRNYLKDS